MYAIFVCTYYAIIVLKISWKILETWGLLILSNNGVTCFSSSLVCRVRLVWRSVVRLVPPAPLGRVGWTKPSPAPLPAAATSPYSDSMSRTSTRSWSLDQSDPTDPRGPRDPPGYRAPSGPRARRVLPAPPGFGESGVRPGTLGPRGWSVRRESRAVTVCLVYPAPPARPHHSHSSHHPANTMM